MLGEKKIYKYLGILDADTIKQIEINEKIKKRVHQETEKKKQFESKVHCRNLIKRINA